MEPTPQRHAESQPRDRSLAGERRHLTVLFCDLVGSTEIAARLDPEEWHEVKASYHRAAAEAITRFSGYVGQYLGDGIMAYFGWPEAHENDGERAARAGLVILEGIRKLNYNATSPKLAARVGIDSGTVVVGAGMDKNAAIFGEAPNTAARLQATAVPGTVLITAATHRLISGLFIVEALGPRALEGIATPAEVFQVVRPTGVHGRLGAARGLTPFVGREEELRLLLSRWERAREGEGQLALIIGEPGIGKSRLVAEFHDRIRDAPHIWMESAGEQLFENTPFYAISEMLSCWLELQGVANAQEQLERIERALAAVGLNVAESAPMIAELLQLPAGERYRASTLSAEQRRRRLLAALSGWAFGAAKLQPLVMVFEDLHWLDPSTLELLQLLAEQGATVPLMLVHTARPEFRAAWPMRTHHSQITLNRLSSRDVREMVAMVAARKALATDSIEAVVERTGGVPLFVEELTRAVLEGSSVRDTGREIPATLRDSLMARLDRLGPAKEVIQIAAVIGREFSYRLLHAVHPTPDNDLQGAIRSAIDAELVYVRGIPPEATYQFKHALIRDAAYEALLKSSRRDLHRLVVRTISERFPAFGEEHPEILAHHWTEADEAESAIAEWSRAGKIMQKRHAFREALENYNHAVALLDMLPESPERDLRELEIRQSLVQLLHLTRGYSAPESIDATRRAVELAQKSGNVRQLLNLMIAMGVNSLSSGDLLAAGNLADQALELAFREGGSNSFFGRAHSLQMMVCFYRGDLTEVERYFTTGLKFFEAPSFKQVPGAGAITFGFASWNAWTLGKTHSAQQREARMMAIVNRDNPFEMAFLGFLVAQLRIWTREYDQAEVSAARAVELSEECQFPWLAALSRAALGHAQARLGRTSEGIGLIRQGMAGLLDTGSRFGMTNVVASLAETCECGGAIMDALEAVEKALQVNPDELVFRPYILRLRGKLQLKQKRMNTAEGDFRESTMLARKMGSKAWELRATMSLVKLLQDKGCHAEARTMLADIYNSFTEGFDTADLKEAKALLDELSS